MGCRVVKDLLANRIARFQELGGHELLAGGYRGIEKESLRISPDGLVAQTPHPRALGSALTNKYITTDYSEALLEFVTPPEPSAWAAMQYMCVTSISMLTVRWAMSCCGL